MGTYTHWIEDSSMGTYTHRVEDSSMGTYTNGLRRGYLYGDIHTQG